MLDQEEQAPIPRKRRALTVQVLCWFGAFAFSFGSYIPQPDLEHAVTLTLAIVYIAWLVPKSIRSAKNA